MARFGMAVVGVGMTAALAMAGPVSWTYQAEFIPTSSPALTVHWQNQSGMYSGSLGDRVGVGLFTTTGFSGPPSDPSQNHILSTFDLHFTLTDVASGQSGTVTYSGSYSSWWEYHSTPDSGGNHWNWVWEISSFGNGPFPVESLILGTNRYELLEEGGGSGQFPSGTIQVGAYHATPEPGTLALAMCGLAIPGVRWLRRRSFKPAPESEPTSPV